MAQHGYIRDYDESRDRNDERWRNEDRERGSRRSDDSRDRGRNFMFGDHDRGGEHDHYLRWRDKQIEALDRDYADYCREREQRFHSDFDTWRSQRGNNPGPLRTGMTQTGQSHDPSGTLELTNEATDNAEPQADPMDAATLGTNSREGR